MGNSKIENLVFPNARLGIVGGGGSISGRQFYNCGSLKTITFTYPDSVPYFANEMLFYCYALESIYVLVNLVEEFKVADGWADYANKIKPIPSSIN